MPQKESYRDVETPTSPSQELRNKILVWSSWFAAQISKLTSPLLMPCSIFKWLHLLQPVAEKNTNIKSEIFKTLVFKTFFWE